MKIAFLGLGIMGNAMAENLLAAGHELVVWNRSLERCHPLVAKGATAVETLAAADICIAMLADHEAACDVVFNEDGVLETMGSGKSYIDMSTVDPQTAEVIGTEIEAAGGRFLEVPVFGSKKPAEDGTLVILTAGALEPEGMCTAFWIKKLRMVCHRYNRAMICISFISAPIGRTDWTN